MGRTNSTYRNHLDRFIEGFNPFRRALRTDNREFLDKLWEKAHEHAQAGSYMNSFRPEVPAMISIMLGIQREVVELREQVQELDERLQEVES